MSADKQLKAYIDRVLRLKEEQDALGDDIREIYAEAKGEGYDKTDLFIAVRAEQQKREGQTVYFAAFRTSGLLKIGVSRDVGRRMKQLAVMRGEPADLLFTIPDASRQIEGWQHAQFGKWRVRGEWFILCPATESAVEQIKARAA